MNNDIVKIPTDQVPKLPPGYFFRATKANVSRFGSDEPVLQIRKKRLFFGIPNGFSYMIKQVKINVGYPHYKLTEEGVLSAMDAAVREFDSERKRALEEARLYGDYPPKKIIK